MHRTDRPSGPEVVCSQSLLSRDREGAVQGIVGLQTIANLWNSVSVTPRSLQGSAAATPLAGRTDGVHNQRHAVGGVDSHFGPLRRCPIVVLKPGFP